MTTAKRTYNLPADVLAEFEKEIAPGKRGAAIAEALREWIEERKRQRLRAEILRGLYEQNELDLEIEREWAPLCDELWSQLPHEEWPEPTESWPDGLETEAHHAQ